MSYDKSQGKARGFEDWLCHFSLATLIRGNEAIISAFSPGWKNPKLYDDQVRVVGKPEIHLNAYGRLVTRSPLVGSNHPAWHRFWTDDEQSGSYRFVRRISIAKRASRQCLIS